MSFLELINSNGLEALLATLTANFLAQLFKTITVSIQHRKIDLSMLVTTGGMPSSHSAAVVALATSIALIDGLNSTTFAVACVFAFVVMYDSAGVRRAAGRQAKVLNEIIDELWSEEHTLSQTKLKELLGHTPKQVYAGAVFGATISLLLRYIVSISV